MDIELLLKGFVVGLSIAAPVGPIGILCIKRTIEDGKFAGFVSGLGAATADGLYGLIAGLGLTMITSFLLDYQEWIQNVGVAFLFYLGIKIFISKPAATSAKAEGGNIYTAYFSTFFLTLTNPITILSFIAIFSGLGMSKVSEQSFSELYIVLGVFLGSTLWWFLLSNFAGLFRKQATESSLLIINKISGSIILIFGIWSLLELYIK